MPPRISVLVRFLGTHQNSDPRRPNHLLAYVYVQPRRSFPPHPPPQSSPLASLVPPAPPPCSPNPPPPQPPHLQKGAPQKGRQSPPQEEAATLALPAPAYQDSLGSPLLVFVSAGTSFLPIEEWRSGLGELQSQSTRGGTPSGPSGAERKAARTGKHGLH